MNKKTIAQALCTFYICLAIILLTASDVHWSICILSLFCFYAAMGYNNMAEQEYREIQLENDLYEHSNY